MHVWSCQNSATATSYPHFKWSQFIIRVVFIEVPIILTVSMYFLQNSFHVFLCCFWFDHIHSFLRYLYSQSFGCLYTLVRIFLGCFDPINIRVGDNPNHMVYYNMSWEQCDHVLVCIFFVPL